MKQTGDKKTDRHKKNGKKQNRQEHFDPGTQSAFPPAAGYGFSFFRSHPHNHTTAAAIPLKNMKPAKKPINRPYHAVETFVFNLHAL